MVARPTPASPFSVNVAGLLADPPGATRDHDVGGVLRALDDDLRLAAPVEGRVHLSRTNRGLLVRAALTTRLAGACSRCLTALDIPLDLRIDEEALPSVDLATGARIDDGEDPQILRIDAHHELDLEGAVRDAVSLAEPIAPLCREDCPGLCPTCGDPLAGPEHEHPDDDVDPRFAALRAFVVDAEAETE